MTWETWLAFAATALALLAMPGPTNLVVVAYGLGLGRAAVWPAVLGAALGRATAMALAALGAGTLLGGSAPLLAGLQAAGAACLAWLGLRLWRAGGRPAAAGPVDPGAGVARILRHVWLVTVLSPFNLAFFAALAPSALDGTGRPWVEGGTLAATFLGLGLAVTLGYGLAAARARALWASPRVLEGCNRVGGAILLGAALVLAPTP